MVLYLQLVEAFMMGRFGRLFEKKGRCRGEKPRHRPKGMI